VVVIDTRKDSKLAELLNSFVFSIHINGIRKYIKVITFINYHLLSLTDVYLYIHVSEY